jgi:hypothetical protein
MAVIGRGIPNVETTAGRTASSEAAGAKRQYRISKGRRRRGVLIINRFKGVFQGARMGLR